MSKSLTIVNHDLTIKEYKGQRVITFKDIDALHERPDGTARRNFNDNKEHFIDGADYFKVCPNEIRTHKIYDISDKAHQDIVFITQSGYLMLVKSLTDDLAWQVQRELVDNYFNKQKPELPTDYLSALKALVIAEEHKIELSEQNAQLSQIVAEQEPAVAFTKAVSASSNSILVGDMAKILKQNGLNIGRDRLFKQLREQGYLCTTGLCYNKPTQYSMDLKIMEYSTNAIVGSSGQVFTKFTPKITGKGQIYFIKRYLKNEAIQQLSLNEAN